MPLYASAFQGGTVPNLTTFTSGIQVPNSSTAVANLAAATTAFGFSSGAPIVRISGTNIAQFNGSGVQALTQFSIGTLGSGDVFLTRTAAATLQFGSTDVNGAAVAQTSRVQSAITGTDQNGANWTLIGSRQTGAGTPGDIIFQTSVKLGTGTTQGTPETGLTITGAILNQKPSVVIGNAAIATDATEGFLYIPTCAGTPTGTPTTRTGRVAIVYDTTNDQFWIYDAGWKQPKTPAAAAIVTWQ